MRSFVAALLFSSSALAFVPSPSTHNAPVRTPVLHSAKDMEGAIKPVGFFDPFKLSELGSDATNAWFRQAEIKHGRVAMAAFVGWMAVASGIHFPGNIATGVSFGSLNMEPLDAWAAVPALGKAQMIAFAGIIEIAGEMSSAEKPHYMKGGKPGVVPYLWDPIGFTKNMSEEKKADKRLKELSNGRLAMIGMMSVFAAATKEGSVPFFSDGLI
jgi:hypothetical protein